MPVTEESRHRLHQTLDDSIGPEDATTLMEHLPPVGWADVATKTDMEALRSGDLALIRKDLVQFEERVDHRFDLVDQRFVRVDERLAEHTRRFDSIDRRFDRVDDRIGRLEDTVRQQTIRLLLFLIAYGGILVAAVAQIRR